MAKLTATRGRQGRPFCAQLGAVAVAVAVLASCSDPPSVPVTPPELATNNAALAAGAAEAELVFQATTAGKSPALHPAARDRARPAEVPAATAPATRPQVAAAPSTPPPVPPPAPPPVAARPLPPTPPVPPPLPVPAKPSVPFAIPSRPFAERGGVGIVAAKRIDGAIVVQKVVPDSPAARAGVRPGDLIVRVGTYSLLGVEQVEATRRLRGPPDSRVEVELQRPAGNRYTVTLVRVDWEKLYPGQVY